MTKSTSIIIPAFKEEEKIKNTLTGIIDSFQKENIKFEILVVIDIVSNDKTFDIVKDLSNSFNEIKIITRNGKLGVASAIKEGILNVSNEISLIVMGDLSESPEDLVKMILKMNSGYDMVFANRFTQKSTFHQYPYKKFIVNRICNWTAKTLFHINSKDITNAVKAYKSSILKNIVIKSTSFEIFLELPLKAYIGGGKNFTEISSSHFAGDPKNSKFSILKDGPKYVKILIHCLTFSR
jgi:dolichol-phosphate mannosyltransferase